MKYSQSAHYDAVILIYSEPELFDKHFFGFLFEFLTLVFGIFGGGQGFRVISLCIHEWS